MTADELAASLAHNRATLIRALKGLDTAALDYQAFPDSKTIGEILLHVAGFEYLIVLCARLTRGETVGTDHWPELKPGFAREAGFDAPRRFDIERYVELAERIRALTVAYFRAGRQNHIVDVGSFDIGRLVDVLRARDPDEDADRYVRLRKGLETSFHDDGAPDADNRVDLAVLIQLHETYHRGQITLAKYYRSRALRRVAEAAAN